MTEKNVCSCGAIRYNLAFACSGSADVGAIADQAARKLSKEKTASICCTAAIAAEIPEILEKATFASKMIVIDGCEKACARKILEQGGFTDLAYVELGMLGLEKDKTPVTEECIARVADAAVIALGEVSEQCC